MAKKFARRGDIYENQLGTLAEVTIPLCGSKGDSCYWGWGAFILSSDGLRVAHIDPTPLDMPPKEDTEEEAWRQAHDFLAMLGFKPSKKAVKITP